MASRSPEPVYLDLTGRQMRFLSRALWMWGGPAHPTDALAALVGRSDADALGADLERLSKAIERGEALPDRDWSTAVLFAGLMVGSRDVGAPLDWETCTGQRLEDAWDDLASVERVVRTRFLASYRPRTILFSGEHEGRRTRVWTDHRLDEIGSVPWPDHVTAAVDGALARHRTRHGEDPADDTWLEVRIDRHRNGGIRPFGFFSRGPR